ncbi:MAG: permease, partial [Runella slithyformis]
MKILDWYILKKFLITYVFVVAVVMLIICMIDFTEKIDNFRERGPTNKEIFFDYY